LREECPTVFALYESLAGLLHITPIGVEDTASRLHCRTADSSDDLLAAPGDVQISVEADAPCTVRVTAKEMWA
jgi:hypothetical protein